MTRRYALPLVFTLACGTIAAISVGTKALARHTLDMAVDCAQYGADETAELLAKLERHPPKDAASTKRLQAINGKLQDGVMMYTQIFEYAKSRKPNSADPLRVTNAFETLLTSWRLNNACVDSYDAIIRGYTYGLAQIAQENLDGQDDQ